MKELCFLDMDGVLADFVSAVCQAHDRPNPYEDPKNLGIFDMAKIWGMTAEEFWEPTNNPYFWRDIPKLPDADELMEAVLTRFGTNNTCILSSPSSSQYCIPEKKQWIQIHYPRLAGHMLFGSAKQFLAGPGRTLIDDYDVNIARFAHAGGHGITYPQPWNKSHSIAPQRIQFVREALKKENSVGRS